MSSLYLPSIFVLVADGGWFSLGSIRDRRLWKYWFWQGMDGDEQGQGWRERRGLFKKAALHLLSLQPLPSHVVLVADVDCWW